MRKAIPKAWKAMVKADVIKPLEKQPHGVTVGA
jgi:hypothetical protein